MVRCRIGARVAKTSDESRLSDSSPSLVHRSSGQPTQLRGVINDDVAVEHREEREREQKLFRRTVDRRRDLDIREGLLVGCRAFVDEADREPRSDLSRLPAARDDAADDRLDRKSTRLNSSH